MHQNPLILPKKFLQMLDSLHLKNQSKLAPWITGSFLFVILFLLLPIPVDNVKYIAASLLAFGFFLYTLVDKDFVFLISKTKVVIALSAFVVLNFLSAFYATDASSALRESFMWLLFSLLAISVSTLVISNKRFEVQLSKLFSIFYIVFLIFHLAAIQLDIGFSGEWPQFMSKNRNYTTTLLTCLSPFIIFYPSKSQFIRFLKVISIVLQSNLLFLTGARGALLAFSIILLLKYWSFYSKWKYRYFGVLLGAIVVVSSIYILNTSTQSSEYKFVKDYRTQLASRILMNKNSIASFSENLIIGVGAGQWYNDIYRHGVGVTDPFSSTEKFIRYRSHNLYFKLLVESGVIGFILFFGSLVGTLWLYRNKWTELSGYQKAAWACLLSYLVAIYFYANAASYEYFFSAITLVAFISLGVLIGGMPSNQANSKYLTISILLLSLSTSAWYIYSKANYNTHKSVKTALKIGDNPNTTLELLKKSYHPIFHSSYSYNTSISQLIAEQYVQIGEIDRAAEYYKEALEQMPYHEPLIRSYINYCIVSNKDKSIVQPYLNILAQIHPNYPMNRQLLKIFNME